MQSPRRAMTMIELVVYFGLSGLVLTAILVFFFQGRRSFESGSQSYLAGIEAESAVRYLRADLAATTLGSVRVYPNPQTPGEGAGLSCASASDFKEGDFKVSPLGAPVWAKHVFYTLEKSGNVLSLVRWNQADAPVQPLPFACTVMPSALTDSTHKRTILRGIAPPKFSHKAMAEPLGAAGGFQVTFVRFDDKGEIKSDRPGESLTGWNPSQAGDGTSGLPFSGNTRMLDVALTFVLPDSSTGGKTSVHLPFRITPRN